MDINTSCLYGSLYSGDVSVFTDFPTSPTSSGGALNVITWALNDFANTPKSIAVPSQTILFFRINLTASKPVNTLYAYFSSPCNFRQSIGTGLDIYLWNGSYYNPMGTQQYTYLNINPEATIYNKVSGGTIIYLENAVNVSSLVIAVTAQSAEATFGCGEIGCGYSAVIPTLPDQQTFTLTPAQPQKQTFTCQNGREIVYYSSTQTRSINATFQWSDEGKTAKDITTVHTHRLDSGSPLLFAMGSDPNNPESRVIELVNSDIQPVNRQAGKVYSHTITGGTQP